MDILEKRFPERGTCPSKGPEVDVPHVFKVQEGDQHGWREKERKGWAEVGDVMGGSTPGPARS